MVFKQKGIKMIRRAAYQVNAGAGIPTTILATGWVLGWYVTGEAATGQTMMATFEENQHGFVFQCPLTQIQFQDGLPAVIPTVG